MDKTDTYRKDAERHPAKLENVLGSALPLVLVTDAIEDPEDIGDADISYVNSNLLTELGFGAQVARQGGSNTLRSLLEMISEDTGIVAEYLETLSTDFVVRDFLIPFRGPGGKRMVVQVTSRLLGLVGGSYYMQGIFQDVTRHHDLEATLVHQQESLQRDLDLAGWVQRSMIPGSRSTAEVSLEVRYVPAAHVGGDYVDYQYSDARTLYVTVCDVSGHGVAAALMANRVNGEVARWIAEGLPAADIVTALNTFFRHHFSPRGIFLSIWIGRLDLETGDLDYAGAGHPPPLLLRARGGLIEPLESQYPLVGAIDRFETPDGFDLPRLAPGDKVVLYTDGLFEVFGESGELLGVDGLERLLDRHRSARAPELARAVLEGVEAYRARPQQDDLSLLILEAGKVGQSSTPDRKPPADEGEPQPVHRRAGENGEHDRFLLSIPSQPRYLGSIRALVGRIAKEISFPEKETRELILAIDEACSNVIKHAYKGRPDEKIDLAFTVQEDSIQVEIRDYGAKISPDEVQPRDLDDVKPGGLGTHFMRCCVESVEFDTSPDEGTILRMTKHRHPQGSPRPEGAPGEPDDGKPGEKP